MPWQCPQCSTEVGDDAVKLCPECGLAKTSWTLVKDQTRRLRVGVGKRFVCERGASERPQDAPLSEAYDAASWATTDVAPALPTSAARALADAGQGPAPRDVLRVVQHPGKGAPSAVELTVLNEGRGSTTTEHEARPGSPPDVRFLLVFGEPPDGLAFDGLEVVDVTDDGPGGHAPHVEVVALKRQPQRLAIEPRGPAVDWDLFSFDVGHDPEPQAPAATADDQPQEEVDWGLFSFAVDRSTAGPDGEVDS